MGEHDALKFVYELSRKLVQQGVRVVSGFGLGIGSAVISGVLEETFTSPTAKIEDQLVLRRFPPCIFSTCWKSTNSLASYSKRPINGCRTAV